MDNREYLTIINPAAGNGLGKSDWNIIRSIFDKKGISYKTYFTENYEATSAYCKEQIDRGFRDFIVIGGDGSLNEVANAMMTHPAYNANEFSFSVIPIGKGNDWCRTFKIPFNYEEALEIISRQKFLLQDVGRVTYQVEEKKESRLFVNVAGMGFDAFVAYKTNLKSDKSKGSALSYLWNLFRSLFQYKSTDVVLKYDDSKHANMVFSLSIGTGKFNGGGMMQLPNAIPNDGFFDMTIINKISKLEIIKNIKKLYDGSLIHHPKIDAYRARKVTLESNPPIKIELDGEVCGNSPFEFELLHRHLKVCTPLENIEV